MKQATAHYSQRFPDRESDLDERFTYFDRRLGPAGAPPPKQGCPQILSAETDAAARKDRRGHMPDSTPGHPVIEGTAP